MSPALEGGFLTTGPSKKSQVEIASTASILDAEVDLECFLKHFVFLLCQIFFG